jgi:hypothetical protein
MAKPTTHRIPAPNGAMFFLYLPAVADKALATASFAEARQLEFNTSNVTLFDAAGAICGRFDRKVIAGWVLIGAPKPA